MCVFLLYKWKKKKIESLCNAYLHVQPANDSIHEDLIFLHVSLLSSLHCVSMVKVRAQSSLICGTCRAAALSAWDPGPMRGKHVQKTICNGKTNPVKDFVDFAARGNGVQLPQVVVTDAFSPSHLANMQAPVYPPVALNTLNLDTHSLSTHWRLSSTFSKTN